jgi:hypothetical protein
VEEEASLMVEEEEEASLLEEEASLLVEEEKEALEEEGCKRFESPLDWLLLWLCGRDDLYHHHPHTCGPSLLSKLFILRFLLFFFTFFSRASCALDYYSCTVLYCTVL